MSIHKCIPQHLYVAKTFSRNNDEILGFVVPYDNVDHKTFKDKKAKADAWAGKSGEGVYLDNVPTSGYRILNNVSRYSTSNVVWRVLHPQGFEFEIYSDNMFELIDSCTIISGVIQDELFLTQQKRLVHEKTPTYLNLVLEHERKSRKISEELSDGDYVTLNREHVSKHGEECNTKDSTVYIYCGRYHMLSFKNSWPRSVNEKSTLQHVIKDVNTNKLKVVKAGDIKYYFKTKDADVNFSKEKIVEELNYNPAQSGLDAVKFGIKPIKYTSIAHHYDVITIEQFHSNIPTYTVIDDIKYAIIGIQRKFKRNTFYNHRQGVYNTPLLVKNNYEDPDEYEQYFVLKKIDDVTAGDINAMFNACYINSYGDKTISITSDVVLNRLRIG